MFVVAIYNADVVLLDLTFMNKQFRFLVHN